MSALSIPVVFGLVTRFEYDTAGQVTAIHVSEHDGARSEIRFRWPDLPMIDIDSPEPAWVTSRLTQPEVQVMRSSVPDRSALMQSALDTVFRKPCACPEQHAGTGACDQQAVRVTVAGGMCSPCALAYSGFESTIWAPVEWPGGEPAPQRVA